ncbi:S41 family peptidase [Flavobacterium rhizosphaerae]|uniref:S41 family peptidase n=1 Tax=Flavobacterium rhizosphaerae TaxID=3163298 RepID=A0ABW8Z196_9FLAO
MKQTIIFLLVIFLSCSKSKPVDPESDRVFINKKYINTVSFNDFNDLGKAYYFIKLWGFLKYNADFDGADVDWDDYFLNNIDRLPKMNKADYVSFIEATLAVFPIPEEKEEKNKTEHYCLLDNNWFSSAYFNKTISDKLTYIFENRTEENTMFISNNSMGNLTFLNEEEYDDSNYPETNIRLLGLARYWNIINYFYIYKNDVDENWDEVLLSHINDFKEAKDVKSYQISVQKLSSKLYDCHSMVYSQYLDSKFFGRFVPNFRMKRIEDTFIVTEIRTTMYDDSQIKVGDVLLKIDGEPVLKRYNYFRTMMRGANPPSEQRIICPYVLSSTNDNMKLLLLREGKKLQVNVSLNDYSKLSKAEKKHKNAEMEKVVERKLPQGTSYLDLTYISRSNFDENMEAVKNADNLILDLRNQFDARILTDLAAFILPETSAFFSSSYADANRPGLLHIVDGYTVGNDNAGYFKGNVYLLVDEHIQSASEFLVMALQASPKTKVIGSQTAGSDGNVVEFRFPGNIKTVFTGIGIYYPDLTATQRHGIKIDYQVDQTIKGIRNGKDEALEKCLSIINTNK